MASFCSLNSRHIYRKIPQNKTGQKGKGDVHLGKAATWADSPLFYSNMHTEIKILLRLFTINVNMQGVSSHPLSWVPRIKFRSSGLQGKCFPSWTFIFPASTVCVLKLRAERCKGSLDYLMFKDTWLSSVGEELTVSWWTWYGNHALLTVSGDGGLKHSLLR